VIVTVAIMGMVQVRADCEVEVVTVRDLLVPAVGTVLVPARVLGTAMRRRALRRIGAPDGQPMLVDVIAMNIVQVTVVHEVGVPLVLDGDVAAATAVRMRMIRMSLAGHLPPPFHLAPKELGRGAFVGLIDDLGRVNRTLPCYVRVVG
jgi:hypothetical protein